MFHIEIKWKFERMSSTQVLIEEKKLIRYENKFQSKSTIYIHSFVTF